MADDDSDIYLEEARAIVIRGEGVFVWIHKNDIDLHRLAEILDVPDQAVVRVHPEEVIYGKYPQELLGYKVNILVCRSGHTSGTMLRMIQDKKLAPNVKLYNLGGGAISIVSPEYLAAIMSA